MILSLSLSLFLYLTLSFSLSLSRSSLSLSLSLCIHLSPCPLESCPSIKQCPYLILKYFPCLTVFDTPRFIVPSLVLLSFPILFLLPLFSLPFFLIPSPLLHRHSRFLCMAIPIHVYLHLILETVFLPIHFQ